MTNRVEEGHHSRYCVFLIVEGALLVITVLMCAGLLSLPDLPPRWTIAIPSALCMWHVVAVPICIFYLIGNPIVMTLSWTSPEARSLRRRLCERDPLSDDEFYARFYEGSGIRRDIPARLRYCLRSADWLIDHAFPTEVLWRLFEEIDIADVLWSIDWEFDVQLRKDALDGTLRIISCPRLTEASYEYLDGTLDNLIRLVCKRTGPQSAMAASTSTSEQLPQGKNN
jgi:hypothetical protein